jgi:transglutaminase-like putative cysteine protease
MSALLYSQMLELFVYCLIMMWILVALLLRVQMGDASTDRLLKVLRVSGIVFLQAAPLAIMLFFFFPRYHGTLGLPLDERTLGFTDTVTPGSVAQLARSDARVMYVQFTGGGDIPLPESMYWRGLVLWDYANGAWTQGSAVNVGAPAGAAEPSGEIAQEIVIEPHNQRWLFALDVPVTRPVNPAESSGWGQLRAGDVLQLAYGKLDHLARYDVSSSMYRPAVRLTPTERRMGTALPDSASDQIDPRVRALAGQLYAEAPGNVRDYVYAVIRYLRHNGFTYTLEPGAEGKGPAWLANFLFRDKRGFCEHFASAFAVLMRVEHVPARVVVGYFGAEHNPYDDTRLVTQARAHAWDEVWIPAGTGADPDFGEWVRFDPTALAAGGAAATADAGNGAPKPGQDEGDLRVIPREPSFLDRTLPTWATDFLREASLRRDQLESNWDSMVLSYDSESQNRLAQALGIGDRARLGLLGICLAAAAVCLFVLHRWMTRRPPVPPVEKLYAAFCRTMARRGIPRASWEGPLAYTGRVAEVFPDAREPIEQLGGIVARERYGPAPGDSAAVEKLRALLAVVSAAQAATVSREPRETSPPQ